MIRRWRIRLRGHTVDLEVNDDDPKQPTASLISDEYGHAEFSKLSLVGALLKGEVTVQGHEASIEAIIESDDIITGVVRIGWFFSTEFTGNLVS